MANFLHSWVPDTFPIPTCFWTSHFLPSTKQFLKLNMFSFLLQPSASQICPFHPFTSKTHKHFLRLTFAPIAYLSKTLCYTIPSWPPCLWALAVTSLITSKSSKPWDPLSESIPINISLNSWISSTVLDSVPPNFSYQKFITHISYLSSPKAVHTCPFVSTSSSFLSKKFSNLFPDLSHTQEGPLLLPILFIGMAAPSCQMAISDWPLHYQHLSSSSSSTSSWSPIAHKSHLSSHTPTFPLPKWFPNTHPN